MKDTSRRRPVSEQIRKGLEEAVRHHRGELALKTTAVELAEIDAGDPGTEGKRPSKESP